jgi:hypothetical protein
MIVSLFVLRLGPAFADDQLYGGAKGEDAMTRKKRNRDVMGDVVED